MNKNTGKLPVDKKLQKANTALIKRLKTKPLSLRYDFTEKGELVDNLHEQIFFICYQLLSQKKFKLSKLQQETIIFLNAKTIVEVVNFLEYSALQAINKIHHQTNKGLH